MGGHIRLLALRWHGKRGQSGCYSHEPGWPHGRLASGHRSSAVLAFIRYKVNPLISIARLIVRLMLADLYDLFAFDDYLKDGYPAVGIREGIGNLAAGE